MQLPGWMKNHVKKVTDFNVAINELNGFFNIAIEKVIIRNFNTIKILNNLISYS
jgi:hypothetical protein